MLSFFPRGVLDEILNLIESVSEGFPFYSYYTLSGENVNVMLECFSFFFLFFFFSFFFCCWLNVEYACIIPDRFHFALLLKFLKLNHTLSEVTSLGELETQVIKKIENQRVTTYADTPFYLKTELLCRGWVWFPAAANVSVKFYSTNQWTRITSYSNSLANWRCCDYVIKRQNENVEVNAAYTAPPLSLTTKLSYGHRKAFVRN